MSSLKSNSESKFNIVSSGRDKFDTGPFIQFVQNSSTDIKLLNTLLGKDILLVKEAIWVKSFEYRSKLDESTKTALNVFMNSNAAILGEYKLDIKFESISGITEDVVIKFKLENKSYPIVLFEAYNLELSTNGIDIKEKGTHSIDEFSFKLKKIDNEEYVKRIQLDN